MVSNSRGQLEVNLKIRRAEETLYEVGEDTHRTCLAPVNKDGEEGWGSTPSETTDSGVCVSLDWFYPLKRQLQCTRKTFLFLPLPVPVGMCDSGIAARLKEKVCKTVGRRGVMNGLQTAFESKWQEVDLRVAEFKMLRFVFQSERQQVLYTDRRNSWGWAVWRWRQRGEVRVEGAEKTQWHILDRNVGTVTMKDGDQEDSWM